MQAKQQKPKQAEKAETKTLSLPAEMLAMSLAKAHRLQTSWSGYVRGLIARDLKG